MDNPLKYFAELRDPRIERNREHLLEEILLIAIAAVLSGAESWNDIADYGEDKREWLKTFLALPSGIPSHDTFNRVFAALDPEEMERGFVAWVSSIAKLTAGEVVAIDGKTLCGAREAGKKPWCIWSRPGPAPTTWCWPSARSMKNPTRLRPFPSC
jgi:hypothetical protein